MRHFINHRGLLVAMALTLPVVGLFNSSSWADLMCPAHADTDTSQVSIECQLQSKTPPKPEIIPVDDYVSVYRYNLPSGQTVLVQPMHHHPIVTLDTWVHTGSVNESTNNNGVSHFLEHLLFKGTDRYQVGDIDRQLESRGATFNAATSKDFTHFYITTASPFFKEALDLHANMLLNATINAPELDRERPVVQEEINRAMDDPMHKAFIAMLGKLYGDKHPYVYDTLGPKTVIQSIPRDNILSYYHHWYQPSHFTTVIVGDVDPGQAALWVQQAFSQPTVLRNDNDSNPQASLPAIKPNTQPDAIVEADPNVAKVQMMIGFNAPESDKKDDTLNTALDMAATILAGSDSSRLSQALVEKQQVVLDIGAGNYTLEHAGLFYLSLEVEPKQLAAAKSALMEQLNTILAHGFTDEEVQRAKTAAIKNFVFLNESSLGTANTLGQYATISSLTNYQEALNRLKALTPKDIHDALRKVMDPQRAVAVEILPETMKADLSKEKNVTRAWLENSPMPALSRGQAVGHASQLQHDEDVDEASLIHRNAAPALNTDANPLMLHDTTPVDVINLANGTKLILKSRPTTRTMAIEVFARGGRLTEPKVGITSLVSKTLLQGTEHYSAQALVETLENQGLSIGIKAEDDYMGVTGSAVKEDADKLLAMLTEVLAHPTFPQDEIDKERRLMIAGIESAQSQPSTVMFENLSTKLYPNHPYGKVGTLLAKALPALTRDDLVSYWKSHMVPENLVITVVGNIDKEKITDTVGAMLDELPESPSAMDCPTPKAPCTANPAYEALQVLTKQPMAVQPLKETVIVRDQKAKQAAAWVGFGWLGPRAEDKQNYVTLKVLNTFLGSGLSSRLFVDLREKRGLAYEVGSLYPSTRERGRFIMYIGTDPKNLSQVLDGFNEEIASLKAKPISDADLTMAKNKLIGQFALAHEGNDDQAFYLGLYEMLGMGYQFDSAYPALIQDVSVADIQHLSKTLFSEARIESIVAPMTKTANKADKATPKK